MHMLTFNLKCVNVCMSGLAFYYLYNHIPFIFIYMYLRISSDG